MSNLRFHWVSVLPAAICLAATLVGCTTSPLDVGPVPIPTVTVAVTPLPTPTPTPTPTPAAITCDTAFTAGLYDKLASDGLTFRDAGMSADADEQVGTDGLRCQWTAPQTDIVVRYANWVRTPQDWDALKGQLLADGYIETGPFAVGRSVSEFDAAYQFRDGVIHYVSPSTFIGWVSVLQ